MLIMNAAVVIWLYSFAYLGSCLFVYISATWYLPIFQHFGALLLYSFPYLGSCLFVLNLFHQVEFAAVFVPGKRMLILLTIRSPPLAAITFHDLVLYTTNEKW